MKTSIKLFIAVLLLSTASFSAQARQKPTAAAKKFQKQLNKEFRNPQESPLTKEDFGKFKKHNFFPIDLKYRVIAKFERAKDPETFKMKTSTKRLPLYDKYGKASFEIDGVAYELILYKSHSSYENEAYKDYLFLPYNDLTNGEETYGGGRYIDLQIPEGDEIIIDFNQSYHPLCAYSYRYSCPVPPRENRLNVRIEAGVKNLEL